MSFVKVFLRRKATPAPKPAELTTSCSSLNEWRNWSSAHPEIFDPKYIATILDHAKRHGVESRFLGKIPPGEVVIHDANYRESFLARGLNPRLRAVLDMMAEQYPAASCVWTTSIYAPEALTPFALLLRGHYARFVGSEFAETEGQRRGLFPVLYQDLLRLDFPSGVFDLVVSNEVFEHVPDLPRALTEIARVLKPGGVLLATFPFLYSSVQTVVKAWFSQDGLQFEGEPEYHGNPVDPKGSLVFQIPGWDVLQTCREAGFREATMEFISSASRGITGAEIAGIHVFRAVR